MSGRTLFGRAKFQRAAKTATTTAKKKTKPATTIAMQAMLGTTTEDDCAVTAVHY
ncbi:MAG: hypothetical protein UY90_C0059G0002 [Candidatus Peregrinibacteria bacterium GW2011_GWA2_54_9]|nr:MAG: hypothetical protein UY90_C0059G0002 [Candidatus Peregrinibacteria bacterium GW2011_GWA2_54_9]